jgi:hypothetical protein
MDGWLATIDSMPFVAHLSRWRVTGSGRTTSIPERSYLTTKAGRLSAELATGSE